MEEGEGESVTIVTNAVDIYEVLEELVHCLLALGFHPESIKDGILAKAEEYNEEQRNIECQME